MKMENEKNTAPLYNEKILEIINEVEKVILGKRSEIVLLLTAMLSGSHVLIEDVPGTGKTTLAATIAKVTGLDFKRAQFTPDVMASDITGFNVYNRQKEQFDRMLTLLFESYIEDIRKDVKCKIIDEWIRSQPAEYRLNEPPERIAADYIACMTDQYFVNEYEQRFVPQIINLKDE